MIKDSHVFSYQRQKWQIQIITGPLPLLDAVNKAVLTVCGGSPPPSLSTSDDSHERGNLPRRAAVFGRLTPAKSCTFPTGTGVFKIKVKSQG